MHTTYSQPPAGTETELKPLQPDAIKQEAFGSQLTQVEELTNELKRLLVNCESTLEAEGIRNEVETLERWAESYRRGVKAAGKISALGPTWLADLRGRLKMAADEVVRLSDEGGQPMTREQVALNDQLLSATRKIDALIPNLELLAQPLHEVVAASELEDTHQK